MENIFLGIYLCLLIYASYKSSTVFVMLYIISSTAFFGFCKSEFIIAGMDIYSFTINMTALIGAILKIKNIISDRILKNTAIFIFIFLLYGILSPYLTGNSGILQSIKAGKEYYFYFFLLYMSANIRYINFNQIFKLIWYIGIYISILYILFFIIGNHTFTPPEYIKTSASIQGKFDSYISMAIFILVHKRFLRMKKKTDYLFYGILVTGLILGGYSSITSTTILLSFSLWILTIRGKFHSRISLIFILPAIISITIGILYAHDKIHYSFSDEKTSIETREINNRYRWELINKQFYTGYGFLDKRTSLMRHVITGNTTSYTESLSFVDSGYVDMMGKFGLTGSIIFLLLPVYFIKSGLRRNLTFSAYVFQMLFVNYTWSVFTFVMGIIPLSVCYAYIYKINKNNYE